MKTWILTVITFAFCFFVHEVRAENAELKQKTYTSPEKIMIMPEGIFFMNEVGDFCPAILVSCDEGGIFVVSEVPCHVCGRKYSHAPWCAYSNLPNQG